MARYLDAVEWIALNDEPTITTIDAVAESISVQLTADLFDKRPVDVALDIVTFRQKFEGA